MISEAEIEKAVNWLRDNAPKAAQARAERVYMEEFRKTIKAQLMAEVNDKPLGAQEVYAYAHSVYQSHLQALKAAVRADAEYAFRREAAQAKINAWQTQCANLRAEGKAYGS